MSLYCLCTAKLVVRSRAKVEIIRAELTEDPSRASAKRETRTEPASEFAVDFDTANEIDDEKMFGKHDRVGLLLPESPLRCVKTGAEQFTAVLANKDDQVKPGDAAFRHYPNVDLFRCPICGAGVAK